MTDHVRFTIDDTALLQYALSLLGTSRSALLDKYKRKHKLHRAKLSHTITVTSTKHYNGQQCYSTELVYNCDTWLVHTTKYGRVKRVLPNTATQRVAPTPIVVYRKQRKVNLVKKHD